jgi:hypothetical protein
MRIIPQLNTLYPGLNSGEYYTYYDDICDIALPADKQITIEDMAVMCENWLEGK